MDKIKVYVKLENNIVVSINSSIFLQDTKDWIEIDNGQGDKYAHAQGHYLEKGLVDEQGRYNYKYVNKKIVLMNEMEKELLFPIPTPKPTNDERLDALESALLEMIMGGM